MEEGDHSFADNIEGVADRSCIGRRDLVHAPAEITTRAGDNVS